MFGDGDQDAELRRAWHTFCDELRAADALVFRDTTPRDALTRATGLRAISRNIALGLQFQLENCDPRFPELMHYFDPIRKQGGDNTDALYVGAPINGTDTYCITGQRGGADYFAVTVLEDGATPWGGKVVGSLFGGDIKTDAEGNFTLWLSPEPQSGNWIKTSPGSWRVTFRQFFSDWEHEAPMTARIERISGDYPLPELSAESLAEGLLAAARWVNVSLNYWADMLDRWQVQPNRFLSYRQLDENAIDATPGGEPLICYWKVPKDEALIIRVRPPKAAWWGVEFGNYWWETMDYRYRLCSSNKAHAQLEDDGEFIAVVSHDDPGLPNWLDPSGFPEGYVTVRWIGADSYPAPQCTQVKRSELFEHLPKGVKRIDASARAEQLRGRHIGINKRFRM